MQGAAGPKAPAMQKLRGQMVGAAERQSTRSWVMEASETNGTDKSRSC